MQPIDRKLSGMTIFSFAVSKYLGLVGHVTGIHFRVSHGAIAGSLVHRSWCLRSRSSNYIITSMIFRILTSCSYGSKRACCPSFSAHRVLGSFPSPKLPAVPTATAFIRDQTQIRQVMLNFEAKLRGATAVASISPPSYRMTL